MVQNILALLSGIIMVSLGLFPGNVAQAGLLQQLELTVQLDEIVLDYPTNLTFYFDATAATQAQKISLNYGTNGRLCTNNYSRQSFAPQPGSQITASWKWDFTQSGSLPPGAEIWWEWEVLFDGGETWTSQRQTFVLDDPRFTWKHLENERLSVYWVDGSSSFGNRILTIAQSSLDHLERNLGIHPLEKIRLTIYPDAGYIHSAMMYTSKWAGGLAVPTYNTLIMAISPAEMSWAETVISHEITHLVIHTRTYNCLGVSLPTWLSEGLAMVTAGERTQEDHQLLIDRLEKGNLPRLVSLAGGFSANADEARLAYIQSAAVLSYLIETFGPEKLDQLLNLIQQGKNADPALLQVYSLDTGGVDQSWRASLGFAATQVMQVTTTTAAQTSVPTLSLWTSAVALTPTPSLPASLTHTHTPSPAHPVIATVTVPSKPSPTVANMADSSPNTPCVVLSGIISLFAIIVMFVAFRKKKLIEP